MTPQFLHQESPNLYDQVKAQIASTLAFYKAEAKDGWTLSEIWDMTTRTVASLADIVDAARGEFTTSTKKDVIRAVFAEFYDEVLAPIDIPYIPAFLENRIVDPKLREVFLKLVDGAYDALVKITLRHRPVPADLPAGNPALPPVMPPGWTPY